MRLTIHAERGLLSINTKAHNQVLDAFSKLEVWPDVVERLGALKARGVRLGLLSNLSEQTLLTNVRRNGLEPLFEAVLSTDQARAVKPAQRLTPWR